MSNTSKSSTSAKKKLDAEMRGKLERVNRVMESSTKAPSGKGKPTKIGKSGVMAATMGFGKSTGTSAKSTGTRSTGDVVSPEEADVVQASLTDKMARANLVMARSTQSSGLNKSYSGYSSSAGGVSIRAALVGELSGSAHDLSDASVPRRPSQSSRRSSLRRRHSGSEEPDEVDQDMEQKLKRVEQVAPGGILNAVFPPSSGQPLTNPIHKQHGGLRDHVLGADVKRNKPGSSEEESENPYAEAEKVADEHWQKANHVRKHVK